MSQAPTVGNRRLWDIVLAVKIGTTELTRLFVAKGSLKDKIGESRKWSPDGGHLAFTYFQRESRTGTVYIIKPSGSDLREVAVINDDLHAGGLSNIEWSADGTQILFSFGTYEDGSRGSIYIVNQDGTSLRRVGDGVYFSGSPDNSRIARLIRASQDSEFSLDTMATDGSSFRVLVRTEDGKLTSEHEK